MSNKNWKILSMTTVVLLLSAMLFGACGLKENTTDDNGKISEPDVYYSFTDDAGQEITLEERPAKVAVLFSSFADVWKTAGGETAITVGESVERGFAGEDVLLVDQGAGKTIDGELLISYEPDFVICSADIEGQVKTAELLTKADIPCAQFHVESFEEYLSMLKICTDITGDKEAYQTYGIDVQKRVEQVRKDAKERLSEGQPQILFVRAGSTYNATKAKTAEDNFVCAMLKELGTYNIAENAPVLLDGLSFEEVILADPEYIFISTMGEEEAAKAYMNSVLSDENWQQLDAVKNGHYTYLPKDMFQYKPNAKWDEAYRYLADLLEQDEN